MKSLLLIAALLLSTASQAAVICSVNVQNQKDANVYDRQIFFGEVNDTNRQILIQNDFRLVSEIKIKADGSWEWPKGYDFNQKSIYVTLMKQEDGSHSIAVGRLGVKNEPYETLAMSSGHVSKKNYVMLFLPSEKLSIYCLELGK